MSLSDCANCWTTPCMCGHEYKQWETEQLVELRDILNRELASRDGAGAPKPESPQGPA